MLTVRDTPSGRVLEREGVFITCESPLFRRYYEWVSEKLSGRVLVTGLGFGILPKTLSRMDSISSVCVLESDPEILERYKVGCPKVICLQADAWTWQSPTVFDWAFHDIWSDNLGSHVLDEEVKMTELYEPFIQVGQITLPRSYAEFLNVAIR